MSGTKLAEAVRGVLKMKAKVGQTTKQEATILVMTKIDKAGGPTKYGIGAAAMRLALTHIISTEVGRQLKMPLSDHAETFVLPKTEPVEMLKKLGSVPEWIAIEEGKDALWMFALKAGADHWIANAQLKQKKANQTQEKANASLEIAMYLEQNHLKSLGDIIKGDY